MTVEAAIGKVWHRRHHPVQHSFTYNAAWLLIDIEEFDQPGRRSGLIGLDVWAPLAVHSKDYLEGGDQGIASRIRRILSDAGITRPMQIKLLTMPRTLGYVFNPVSFYLCFDSESAPSAIIAEVNNTFDERRIYLLRDGRDLARGWREFRWSKDFYVSPFFPAHGEYRLTVRKRDARIELRIAVFEDGRRNFSSGISATLRPAVAALTPALAASAWCAMARIHKQAFRLFFRLGVRLTRKPTLAPPAFFPNGRARCAGQFRSRAIEYARQHLSDLSGGKHL